MVKKKGVPSRIVAWVNQGRLVLSQKARAQADEYQNAYPWFTTFDLEHSLCYGAVVKKEKDETGESKYKYVIVGPSLNGTPVYSCGKIVKRGASFYFVMTFHELR